MMMKYSTEEKAKYLEGWEASGKGAFEYAREVGVKGQTFSKWVKKQAGGGKPFVEIKKAGIAPFIGEIVVEKGDIKVRLPLGMSGNEIRSVMEGTGLLP
jgi:transposase-like protein